MLLDDRYVKKFVTKLYRFIDAGHEIEFKKMREYKGWITVPGKRFRDANKDYTTTILLDPRDDLLSTFVHEAIHHMHPDWEEEEVLGAESTIMKKLTCRQMKNITKRLANALQLTNLNNMHIFKYSQEFYDN